jgi:hypothetical protein
MDPGVYNLKIADKVLIFHADYNLCLEGANQVKDQEELKAVSSP